MPTYGTGTYGHPGGFQQSDINAIALAVQLQLQPDLVNLDNLDLPVSTVQTTALDAAKKAALAAALSA
jgi:hypothetical protein